MKLITSSSFHFSPHSPVMIINYLSLDLQFITNWNTKQGTTARAARSWSPACYNSSSLNVKKTEITVFCNYRFMLLYKCDAKSYTITKREWGKTGSKDTIQTHSHRYLWLSDYENQTRLTDHSNDRERTVRAVTAAVNILTVPGATLYAVPTTVIQHTEIWKCVRRFTANYLAWSNANGES
jgi:hypothetical protein